MVSSMSNVLQPSNNESWATLLKHNPNISVIILLSTDAYGQILANNLTQGATQSILTENLGEIFCYFIYWHLCN